MPSSNVEYQWVSSQLPIRDLSLPKISVPRMSPRLRLAPGFRSKFCFTWRLMDSLGSLIKYNREILWALSWSQEYIGQFWGHNPACQCSPALRCSINTWNTFEHRTNIPRVMTRIVVLYLFLYDVIGDACHLTPVAIVLQRANLGCSWTRKDYDVRVWIGWFIQNYWWIFSAQRWLLSDLKVTFAIEDCGWRVTFHSMKNWASESWPWMPVVWLELERWKTPSWVAKYWQCKRGGTLCCRLPWPT